MKIATYNVNGVNGRLPRLVEWLEETSPDVVCLQELKTIDSNCPMKAIEDAGYRAIWHGQGSHHGVAILAQGARRRARSAAACRATALTCRRAISKRKWAGSWAAPRGRRRGCRIPRARSAERPCAHVDHAGLEGRG